MESTKRKTQIYLVVFSLIMTLVGLAYMKLSVGDPPRSMTSEQKIRALQKAAPQSPQLSRFLKNQADNQEAQNLVNGEDTK